MKMSVGDRIRETRNARQLSLTEVAAQAKVSVATLSRIERGLQTLDFGVFLLLCQILGANPRELIDSDDTSIVDPLALRIACSSHTERMEMWRDLTERRKAIGTKTRSLSDEVDELLAQMEYVRAEVQSVRKKLSGGSRTAARPRTR